MSFLTEWLTTIVLFILFAIVIDMLLPSSSMQKYAKMVVSLLLIVVMLTPIFKLFKTDPEVIFEYLTKNGQSESADIKNQINSKKNRNTSFPARIYSRRNGCPTKKESGGEIQS